MSTEVLSPWALVVSVVFISLFTLGLAFVAVLDRELALSLWRAAQQHQRRLLLIVGLVLAWLIVAGGDCERERPYPTEVPEKAPECRSGTQKRFLEDNQWRCGVEGERQRPR